MVWAHRYLPWSQERDALLRLYRSGLDEQRRPSRFFLGDLLPTNLVGGAAGVAARAADWQFGSLLPPSCTACSDSAQLTELVEWRLTHDTGVRDAFQATDGDATSRFFAPFPTQVDYRDAVLAAHGPVTAAHPERYRRFVRSGDDSHTAIADDTFYTATADGVPLYSWVGEFVSGGAGWVDVVEDFVPLP